MLIEFLNDDIFNFYAFHLENFARNKILFSGTKYNVASFCMVFIIYRFRACAIVYIKKRVYLFHTDILEVFSFLKVKQYFFISYMAFDYKVMQYDFHDGTAWPFLVNYALQFFHFFAAIHFFVYRLL
jgi:hypothetical protein